MHVYFHSLLFAYKNQARIQEFSSGGGGVQPSKNFDKQWKKKPRKRRGRGLFSNYSALVWSKYIFAIETALQSRPYKKKILVLRHRRALKIPPDETFLSWEGKKIAAARKISHADKNNPDFGGRLSLFSPHLPPPIISRAWAPKSTDFHQSPAFVMSKTSKQLFSS